MVKHLVLWKLEAVAEGNTYDDNAKLIKEDLEALVGTIDGLLSLEVHRCFGKGYNLVLESEFTDRDALAAYNQHPDHLKVREFIHRVITERAVADYEV